MRKVLTASVALVIVAAVVGGSAAARGALKLAQGGRAAKIQRPVVKLYTSARQASLVDVGQAGFSLGDQDVFSDDVFRKKNGAKVGVDGGVCTVVRVTNATARSGLDQCLITRPTGSSPPSRP